jgi:hypothetical protein
MGCGQSFTTKISGNTTRHACGHTQYVPAENNEPRSTIELVCMACGHEWTSKAKPGATVRCPRIDASGAKCGHARRVPAATERRSAAPVAPPVPLVEPAQAARPAPAAVRPPTGTPNPAPAGPAPRSAPAPARPIVPPVPAAPARRTEQHRPAAAGAGPWAALRAGIPGLTAPVARREPNAWETVLTAAAGALFAGRALAGSTAAAGAGPAAVLPVDPAAVDRALAALILTRDHSAPAGACPVGSCGAPAAVRVQWAPAVRLDVCDRHAERIRAAADRLGRTVPGMARL